MLDTDGEVFEAVRALVARGEYLDCLPGVPGVNVEGGGAFRQLDGGVLQRLYTRGSPEHFAARRLGLVERLPALEPASIEAVQECEAVVGHRLPALLRRLYLEVGNGGFGPGYGILGVRGGHDAHSGTAIGLYQKRSQWQGAWQSLPKGLLPICEWGCGIYSFVDCADKTAVMWAVDPNPAPDDELEVALFRQDIVFGELLRRWVDGTLYQPALVQDPDTGDWRGATDEELERWFAEQF